MKISVLTSNFSENCFGRAYVLAKILGRQYKVEIVGPLLGEGIWEPLATDRSMTYKFVKGCTKLEKYRQIIESAKSVDGDVVYVSKPFFATLGTGLLKRILSGRKLVLDIDDWEVGFLKESYANSSFLYRNKFLTTQFWNCLISEKLIRFVDEITVSNRFLQENYGGTIVYHARDTESFDPGRFDKDMLREKYNIERNMRVVIFIGTPKPHKGIEDLIKAMGLIKDTDIILVVMGIDDRDPYSRRLVQIAERILNRRFRGYGLQPFHRIPEFLTIADVVVLPQKRNLATVGQIPAKVFDAMAMAKPTIATNVSDLPEILEDCGWIVEPNNCEQLAETIQNVLEDYENAKQTGWKARRKCVEKYSWNAMENVLMGVFRKYE